MADTELLNWIEQNHAQLWHNKNSGWTVQIWYEPGKCFQPTRPTLREAIIAAMKGEK